MTLEQLIASSHDVDVKQSLERKVAKIEARYHS